MNKIYVVMERNYEYNDETYDSSGGGNSVIAFDSKWLADYEALSQTVDLFKSRDGAYMLLGNYRNPWDYHVEDDITKAGFDIDNLEDYEEMENFLNYLKNADESLLYKLAGYLLEDIFYVVEVPIA